MSPNNSRLRLPILTFAALAVAALLSPGSAIAKDGPMLGHTVYGQGAEKVIMFHDWMGDSSNFEPLVPFLDPQAFTYVFPDLRGYGRSRHLKGEYSADEAAADGFRLAESLGWESFHAVGHSMSGMIVQRMALDDWKTGTRRIKSVVAVTPVSADGYPADEGTKNFLWSLIGKRDLSEQGFFMLTGQRLTPAWGRYKADRHLQTSSEAALKGYYRMWLETDFSADVKAAKIGMPVLVVGGRQDLPGFQEEHLRKTFGAWYPKAQFSFITDAGHYPMHETPVYLASLIEAFLKTSK